MILQTPMDELRPKLVCVEVHTLVEFDTNQRCTRDRCRVIWDEFVHYQMMANGVYAEAGSQFSVTSQDVRINAQCPRFALKSLCLARVLFVSSSSYWGGVSSLSREDRNAV